MGFVIVQLDARPPDPCCVCGKEDYVPGHSLPMFEGEVADPDLTDDWAGFDCCKDCYVKNN